MQDSGTPEQITDAARCVYCLRDNELDGPIFFNREHVVPAHLVRGTPHQPILYRLVCERCNNYFAKLDSLLAANTYLEIMNSLLGIYPATFRKRRQSPPQPHQFTVRSAQFEFLNGFGACLRDGKIQMKFAPSIAIRERGSSSWQLHNVSSLPLNVLYELGEYETEAVIISPNELISYYASRMQSVGFQVQVLKESDLYIIAKQSLLRQVHRAIMKVAFNYFVWILHRHDPSRAFNKVFQPVRDYLRWDQLPQEFSHDRMYQSFYYTSRFDSNGLSMRINNEYDIVMIDVDLYHFHWLIEFDQWRTFEIPESANYSQFRWKAAS